MLFRSTRSRESSLLVHAPGKLNFFLEIQGKRSDGFHELETLMVSLDLYDSLEFTSDASGRIGLQSFPAGDRGARSAVDDVPDDDDNLVLRAARALCAYTGQTRGVRIRLAKRIPVAAGLAGGSSDAAATLVALNRLWSAGLSTSELRKLAAQLGSDVPFFLGSHPAAICRGRGESIEPLPGPRNWHFVVVRPPTGLSTADVFGRCRVESRPRSVTRLVDCLAAGRKRAAAAEFYNALETPACQLNSEIDSLRMVFRSQPFLGHMMTGSGSAYFGLCASRRQARHAARRIRARRVGQVYVTCSRT